MGEMSRLPLPAAPFEHVASRLPRVPGLAGAMTRSGLPDLIVGTNIGLEGLAMTGRRVARSIGAAFSLIPFVHLGSADDQVARRYVSMPHQRRLIRLADSIVAMTRVEASFVEQLGVPAERIVVAGAGVSLTDAAGGNGAAFRERYHVTGRLIVSLGALAPDKGSCDLVSAVACLRARGHDVEVALAGPSLRSFERWYTGLDADLREGSRLLGVISAAEKRDMLAAADVVALPSRTESFGIVFLEGWANRKPVIGADAGAVPELIQDGANGLLVPFGHVSSLAGAIERLLEDDQLSNELGERGHDLVVKRFTWDAVYERCKRAFEIALGRPL
jgi:glycosyltransferase involved in cell wall biosynthesis